jgi:site-specific DNA-cytosine methylase
MNRLSLFDGMSCGQIAFNKIGVVSGKYYAAEIDKYAIKVTQANYPNTIQLGSVTEWREWDLDWSTIDFVSGGFPCQAWSMAGKQLGDKDERGMLFWVMLDIMKHAKQANPKIKFLIENVRMKKEFEDYITHHTEQALGEVNKVLINSALVSAQNRNRFYWTNWHVEQPEDKGIKFQSILDNGYVEKEKSWAMLNSWNRFPKKQESAIGRYKRSMMPIIFNDISFDFNNGWREPTVAEAERLQTVPNGYCEIVSDKHAKGMLGNGWTVDVIAHILSQMQMPVKAATGQLDMFGDYYEN